MCLHMKLSRRRTKSHHTRTPIQRGCSTATTISCFWQLSCLQSHSSGFIVRDLQNRGSQSRGGWDSASPPQVDMGATMAVLDSRSLGDSDGPVDPRLRTTVLWNPELRDLQAHMGECSAPGLVSKSFISLLSITPDRYGGPLHLGFGQNRTASILWTKGPRK